MNLSQKKTEPRKTAGKDSTADDRQSMQAKEDGQVIHIEASEEPEEQLMEWIGMEGMH